MKGTWPYTGLEDTAPPLESSPHQSRPPPVSLCPLLRPSHQLPGVSLSMPNSFPHVPQPSCTTDASPPPSFTVHPVLIPAPPHTGTCTHPTPQDGNTPLRLATKHGRTEAIRVLTAAGAPLEHKAKVCMHEVSRGWRVLTLTGTCGRRSDIGGLRVLSLLPRWLLAGAWSCPPSVAPLHLGACTSCCIILTDAWLLAFCRSSHASRTATRRDARRLLTARRTATGNGWRLGKPRAQMTV